MPTNITGIEDFRGDRLVHSSGFTEPTKNAKGKKAVVIGCCNSGHDIARDYYDNGYDITMVQRSSTMVVTCETLIDVTMKGVYEENGVSRYPSTITLRIFLEPLNISISKPLCPKKNWVIFWISSWMTTKTHYLKHRHLTKRQWII